MSAEASSFDQTHVPCKLFVLCGAGYHQFLWSDELRDKVAGGPFVS